MRWFFFRLVSTLNGTVNVQKSIRNIELHILDQGIHLLSLGQGFFVIFPFFFKGPPKAKT